MAELLWSLDSTISMVNMGTWVRVVSMGTGSPKKIINLLVIVILLT